MKNKLLLIAVLLSFPVFSQIGTHKFNLSLSTRVEKVSKENKSTLIILDKPHYGDVKLIINNHEAYFYSEDTFEKFTHDDTGLHLTYHRLTNRKTKEKVTLKFYYDGLNPSAIFIFSDGKQLILQNELKF